MRVGRYFVIGLLAFGVLVGFVVGSSPRLRELPVPAVIWPVLFALLTELALLPLVRAGRVEALTMSERAIGVFGAALVVTLILAATPAR
jgi:hypothetical protein